MKNIFVYVFLLVAFSSIGGTTLKQQTKTPSLEGEWFLQPAMASDTATGTTPTLKFSLKESSFSGNTGCNSLKGRFSVQGDSLIFNNQLVTTKMACQGYNEKAFLDNLMSTTNYRFEDGFLFLLNDKTILSKWGRSKQGLVKEKA
ncbi:META domain-containing protein [Danxiaibacter flavus]|uniref:META domain-containing protein n=1 Tax=Danxiaibacter flavus TaxID=3049108 RepID=A0ABV3ZGU5_9BACT|nr:META domain-containing protein [Chitinophagaceae bacterium DXS]